MNLGWQITPIEALAERILADVHGRPAVVAVNGHSSSGKTTLSRRLQPLLPRADVLHTDDLAWHQGVFAWDELLLNDVLPVVRSGQPLSYRPPQWVTRGRDGAVELRGDLQFLILEGVGASQESVRDRVDFTIWVEADEPTRAARDGFRVGAGETSAAGYLHWMVEECAYGSQPPRKSGSPARRAVTPLSPWTRQHRGRRLYEKPQKGERLQKRHTLD